MKILLTTEYFPPFTPGGTPWSILFMGKALIAEGHDVSVLTPNYGAAPREVYEGIHVQRYPFWTTLPKGGSMVKPWQHVNPFFHLYTAFVLFRAAHARRPDVIHVQEKHSLVSSWIVGHLLGIPVFLTFRDMGFVCPIATCLLSHSEVPADCGHRKLHTECAEFFNDHYAQKRGWKKALLKAWLHVTFLDIRLKRQLLSTLNGVFGVSRAILTLYGRLTRLPAQQSVLYNLPPTDDRPASDDKQPQHPRLASGPVVLYVGKLSLGKGFPVYLEAARRLRDKHPKAVFAAAGSPTQNFGPAPDNFLPLGSVNQAALAQLYKTSAFVVLPSVWPEPFSRIPLEAAAAGKACVGTRKGGTPEFVRDGETGLLVDAGNADQLTAAIDQLLAAPDTARRMGDTAKQRLVTDFQPHRWVEDLLAQYGQASAPKRARRTVGVLASMGGMKNMQAIGQHERLLNYDLTYYAKNFDRVYYFSYLRERLEDYTNDPFLLERVRLIPRPFWIPRKLYAFLMPFVRARYFLKCDAFRAYQLTGVIPAIIARFLFGTPYVTTYGYHYAALERINGRPWKARGYEALTRWVIPNANGVLVTNDEIFVDLQRRFPEANLLLVPNGVDMKQFSPAPRSKTAGLNLLYIGRLEHEKNVARLVEAVGKIKTDRVVTLTLAGGGSQQALLEDVARKAGTKTIFKGVVRHSELPALMKEADGFVLSSFKEGQPKALLEAMASGLPCAISETAGGAEIVRRADCGITLDPESTERMTAALADMLSDGERLAQWGAHARAWAVQHFDIEALMTQEAAFVARCGGLPPL